MSPITTLSRHAKQDSLGSFNNPDSLELDEDFVDPNDDDNFDDQHSQLKAFYDESLLPLSERERRYYRDYDPMVGYRIALSLGIIILLFTIFILYKTHCRAKKNRRLIAQSSVQLPMSSMN